MFKTGGKGFLLTTKFYKSTNRTASFSFDKKNLEGKSAVYSEGAMFKNEEQMTTTELATQKIHANNIHMKIGHSVEFIMCVTMKSIH